METHLNTGISVGMHGFRFKIAVPQTHIMDTVECRCVRLVP